MHHVIPSAPARRHLGIRGFTIVEALIVLAIGGLFLLLVFLIVPAMQRQGRNTTRHDDISTLASVISRYESNNLGAIPSTCSAGSCSISNLLNSANLNSYSNLSNALTITQNAGLPTGPSPTLSSSNDDLLITNWYRCSDDGDSATTTGAASRDVVILYQLESGSGYAQHCYQV